MLSFRVLWCYFIPMPELSFEFWFLKDIISMLKNIQYIVDNLWILSFFFFFFFDFFLIRFRSLCLHSVLCINTNVILFYFVTAILKTIIMPLLSFYVLSMMNYIPVCLGPIVDLNYTSMPPFHAFVKYLIKLIVTCSSRYISSAINNFRPVLK